jgi:hypothetical protein
MSVGDLNCELPTTNSTRDPLPPPRGGGHRLPELTVADISTRVQIESEYRSTPQYAATSGFLILLLYRSLKHPRGAKSRFRGLLGQTWIFDISLRRGHTAQNSRATFYKCTATPPPASRKYVMRWCRTRCAAHWRTERTRTPHAPCAHTSGSTSRAARRELLVDMRIVVRGARTDRHEQS